MAILMRAWIYSIAGFRFFVVYTCHMKLNATQKYQNLYAQFWLYPLLLALTGLIVLAITLFIDVSLSTHYLFHEYRWFKIDLAGMRDILSILATTSITITSITFSLTVLTLSIASNQLGPRLLPIFLQQGRTQFIIGLFVSVYVYALVLLVLISNNYFDDQPIFFSLYFGIIIAIISFFMLIYFIHYVCSIIQVDFVIQYIAKETKDSMGRVFVQNNDQDKNSTYQPANPFKDSNNGMEVVSNSVGYVQTVDTDSLLKTAKNEDVTIEVLVQPGSYVFKELPLVKVHGHNKNIKNIEKDIRNAFITYTYRSMTQDVEYGFDQIAEIAIRAMSKSTNNPFTAINCVNTIGGLLQFLSTRRLHNGHFYGEKDQLRVVVPPVTYKQIIDTTFDQIREHSKAYVNVTKTILAVIDELLSIDLPQEMQTVLREQAQCILDEAKKQNFHEKDIEAINRCAQLSQRQVDLTFHD